MVVLSVSTAGRSIRTNSVRLDYWEEVGICRTSHQPDECGTWLFRWG